MVQEPMEVKRGIWPSQNMGLADPDRCEFTKSRSIWIRVKLPTPRNSYVCPVEFDNN